MNVITISLISLILLILGQVNGYAPIAKNLTAKEIDEFNYSVNKDPNVHQVTLDYDGKYKLSWEYDKDTITFDLIVEAKGWIGLGFSETSGMAGADIVFIWIDNNGTARISDTHSKKNGYPKKDASQDYKLLAASKSESLFRAKFQRKRDTCDDEGDYRLTADNTKIIYAFSDVQPSDEDHFAKHLATNRGVKGVYLFDRPVAKIPLPPDTITLDFLSDATRLPTDYHLLYWCQMFEMPKWPVHHLIRLEPILEKHHAPYVHHIALWQCSRNMSAYLGKGERCFTGDGFNFTKMYECATKIIWFWNPAMEPTVMPNDVGMPFFENIADSYIMFEVHYENVELKPDIIDNSGIRMYLTPTLRPIEAGIMILGTVEQAPNQLVPPGEPDFHFYAHFDNCLMQLPKNGTNLLYSLLHQHLNGKHIRMHHYRNGMQLPDFAVDDNYDFFAQSFRLLDPPRLVLPGDELVLECRYNTSRVNRTIYGGYSTYDEMCLSAHFYYPRVAKGFTCVTYPDPEVYVPIFGSQLEQNDTVRLPSNETVSLYDFVKHHLDWDKPNVREKYIDLVSNGQYVQTFIYQPLQNSSNADHNPLQIHTFKHDRYPKVTQPWIPELDQRQCSATGNVKIKDSNQNFSGKSELRERSSALKNWSYSTIYGILLMTAIGRIGLYF